MKLKERLKYRLPNKLKGLLRRKGGDTALRGASAGGNTGDQQIAKVIQMFYLFQKAFF